MINIEIERKYLANVDNIDLKIYPHEFQLQAYLSFNPVVRIRLESNKSNFIDANDKALLTIKGPGQLSRQETEYNIPVEDFTTLIKLCHGYTIAKTRYYVDRFQVDVYDGHFSGLVVAEIELEDKNDEVPSPSQGLILEREVTYERRYKNSEMAKQGVTI